MSQTMERAVPLDFALEHQALDWAEIDLGVREGWLTPADAVVVAERRVSAGLATDRETELAMQARDDRDAVMPLLAQLAGGSLASVQSVRAVWMRIWLARIYEARARLADPLGDVEQVYAQFGYPPEIRHLIRYEAGTLSLGPGETPEVRLLALLGEYVMGLRER